MQKEEYECMCIEMGDLKKKDDEVMGWWDGESRR